MSTKVEKKPTNAKRATKATAVKQQLTKEAQKPIVSVKPVKQEPKAVSIDARIQNFEKLRGLANNRERLTQTLNELTKFHYNQDESASFVIRDSSGLEFKTGNSNLIKLVTSHLQTTLEKRKSEIEDEIVQFEL